ncbi:MAG: Sua5/YciO/YrdC/YwlC family protein [Planctomycetes bacterium]|nr:Sua5/YciO/YrdC/YwlC family protein [Planctomycetota bacterium]
MPPEIFGTGNPALAQSDIKSIASLIDKGKIIVMATECSYVLCTSLEHSSQLKIQKNFNLSEKYVLLGSHTQLLQYISKIAPVAKRLIQKFWPGPLVLRLSIDNKKNGNMHEYFGNPSDPAVQGIINSCKKTIICADILDTSNLPLTISGNPGSAFTDIADAVVFSGKPKFTKAPTIVDMSLSPPLVINEGAIPSDIVKDNLFVNVLFVCAGNTCRSPLGKHLFIHMMKGTKFESSFRSDSCGVFAAPNTPASENTKTVLSELGIKDISHLSKPINKELVETSDIIYCMEKTIMSAIQSEYSDSIYQIELLDPDGNNIQDPIGCALETYKQTAGKITEALKIRFKSCI